MAELEELEQEELDEQLIQIGGPSTEELPAVPTAEPASSGEYHISFQNKAKRCTFWPNSQSTGTSGTDIVHEYLCHVFLTHKKGNAFL